MRKNKFEKMKRHAPGEKQRCAEVLDDWRVQRQELLDATRHTEEIGGENVTFVPRTTVSASAEKPSEDARELLDQSQWISFRGEPYNCSENYSNTNWNFVSSQHIHCKCKQLYNPKRGHLHAPCNAKPSFLFSGITRDTCERLGAFNDDFIELQSTMQILQKDGVSVFSKSKEDRAKWKSQFEEKKKDIQRWQGVISCDACKKEFTQLLQNWNYDSLEMVYKCIDRIPEDEDTMRHAPIPRSDARAPPQPASPARQSPGARMGAPSAQSRAQAHEPSAPSQQRRKQSSSDSSRTYTKSSSSSSSKDSHRNHHRDGHNDLSKNDIKRIIKETLHEQQKQLAKHPNRFNQYKQFPDCDRDFDFEENDCGCAGGGQQPAVTGGANGVGNIPTFPSSVPTQAPLPMTQTPTASPPPAPTPPKEEKKVVSIKLPEADAHETQETPTQVGVPIYSNLHPDPVQPTPSPPTTQQGGLSRPAFIGLFIGCLVIGLLFILFLYRYMKGSKGGAEAPSVATTLSSPSTSVTSVSTVPSAVGTPMQPTMIPPESIPLTTPTTPATPTDIPIVSSLETATPTPPEVSPEVTPEVSPAVTPEATPEVTSAETASPPTTTAQGPNCVEVCT